MLRLYVLILLLVSPILSQAQNLKSNYDDYQSTFAKILSVSSQKESFLKNYSALRMQIEKKYQTFAELEKDQLTTMGNQMAVQLEMLAPLDYLNSQKISPENCKAAAHLNELSINSSKKTYELIQQAITSLCQ